MRPLQSVVARIRQAAVRFMVSGNPCIFFCIIVTNFSAPVRAAVIYKNNFQRQKILRNQ